MRPASGKDHTFVTDIGRSDEGSHVQSVRRYAATNRQLAIDFPAQKPPEKLESRIVAIVCVGVDAPSGLIVRAMASRAASNCAVLAGVIEERTIANDRHAARQAVYKRAFSLLGVASTLDPNMQISAASEPT